MAESEEELKSRLMKVKEESEEVVLKLNIEKTKTIWSSHFLANRCGGGGRCVHENGNSGRFYFLGI